MTNNDKGFTLVELLVAMAISLIVMASIGYLYYYQQKSYVVQEQISAMQQNLRAAMYYMEKEIRMAGCDPTQADWPRIVTASKNSINFTLDITDGSGTGPPDGNPGDANEDITYSLDTVDDQLERNSQPLAENIDALNFVYLNSSGADLQDDGNGNVTIATNISQIRSVQITIVARVGRRDPGYTDTNAYFNQQDLVNPILAAQNDSFRRKLLTTTIKCRNL